LIIRQPGGNGYGEKKRAAVALPGENAGRPS
jgi:hypothetical protein